MTTTAKKKKRLEKEANRLWQLAVIKKYGKLCEVDGRSGGPPHHFYAKGSYGHMKFLIENGIVLCLACHYSLHFTQRRTQIEEIIKRKRGQDWADKMFAISKEKHESFRTIKYFEDTIKRLKNEISTSQDLTS